MQGIKKKMRCNVHFSHKAGHFSQSKYQNFSKSYETSMSYTL